MPSPYLIPVIVFISMLLAPAQAFAQGAQTSIVGGPGGMPFKLNCPNYQSLAGVYIRFGSLIDQIDAICVEAPDGAWRNAPRRVMSNGHNYRTEDGAFVVFDADGYAVGGLGGTQENSLVCTRDSVVYALTIATAQFSARNGAHDVVGKIDIHCVNPRTGSEDVVTSIPGPEGAGEYVTRWPADCRSQTGQFWATGLVGRYGTYIDALGLRCASGKAPARERRKEDAMAASPSPQSAPSAAAIRGLGASPGFSAKRTVRNIPAPAAARLTFAPPLTESGEKLHYCTGLPFVECGKPAVAFCQQKGFAAMEGYTTEAVSRSQTLSGEICAAPDCPAFRDITCKQ